MSAAVRYFYVRLSAMASASFRRKHDPLIQKILRTGLFDAGFYLASYPDVRDAGVDPIVHFLRVGGLEGRMPSAWFDSAYYLRMHPEVAGAGTNPLVHYIDQGAGKGYNPHPLFDPAYYLRENPDIAGAGVNPFRHYLEHGAAEGRKPNPLFDPAYYLRENPEIAGSGENSLSHFCSHGAAEGRKPNPLFDPAYYLNRNPDVKAAGVNPLAHFLDRGDIEGRRPSPLFDPRFYRNEYSAAQVAGIPSLAHYLQFGVEAGNAVNPSRRPVHAGQKPAAARIAEIREEIQRFRHQPKISVLVPVYDQSARWLERMIASVEAQVYTNWELCLVDDGSTNPETLHTLKRYATPDPGRISIAFLGRNLGIAGATNAALYLSSGEFVAMLDHDDELAPDALFEVAKALDKEPDLDVIYSDEDKVDAEGWLDEPFHKPDWSPEFFRHVMYVGHLLTVRRSLAIGIGGMDGRFNGVQDFDFLLRASERTTRIHHIPKVLYHWRKLPGSIALGTGEKPGIGDLQVAAVNAHLDRRQIPARAERHPGIPHRVVIRPLPRRTHPLVSIVIPTRDQPKLLRGCLKSIFEKTTYPNFEVILVDNCTTDPEARRLFAEYRTTVVPHPEPFNYSHANNSGAERAGGEYLVLLNNDTEVRTAEWLEELLFYAENPEVGAVAPLLLYPDDTVQHAGVCLGMRETADHIMRGFPKDSDGYFGSLSCTREVSAVTAACMMLRRQTFLEAGGFREAFRTIYQDVDFCLRLRACGKRILFTPRAVLCHFESCSRGQKYDLQDRILLQDLWGKSIRAGDPYFNPNLDALSGSYVPLEA